MSHEVALVSGGFDPIHPGHIQLFKDASQYGKLIVGLNSDAWLTRKKGAPFMSWNNRAAIIMALRRVDRVIAFNDKDDTASDAIRCVREMFPSSKIFFCNGGDRTKENIPEMSCGIDNVEYVFGVGGSDKRASSSIIQQVEKRPWGFYHVLARGDGWLVKRIVVNPGEMTSLQRHKHRGERIIRIPSGESWYIPPWSEHRFGEGEYIEIQIGKIIDEDDIIRTEDKYDRD